LAKKLLEPAKRILFERYDFVVAYHGCRVKSKADYKECGLCPSDHSKLLEQAKNLFNGLPQLDLALKQLTNDLEIRKIHDGKLFLYASEKYGLNEQKGDQFQGSEIIGSMLTKFEMIGNQDVFLEAKRRFEDSGVRTSIKCKLPLDWFLDSEIFEDDRISQFPLFVLEELIETKKNSSNPNRNSEGICCLKKAIPFENLIEFKEVYKRG
jgi:hypothetical protein